MLVAIHQPHYLPWLGYVEKADRADIFVFLDTVEFSRGGWQNRNYVRAGRTRQLLSVPVRHLGETSTIVETQVSNSQNWRRKHRQAMCQAYGSAPFFSQVGPSMLDVYEREWNTLADLATASSECALRAFGVRSELLRASQLGALAPRKSALLVEICRRVGATAYLSGDGAHYLDRQLFEEAGIEIVFQKFVHPIYPQRGGAEFQSHLCAWDMLVNVGPSDAIDHLRRHQPGRRA